ncbi:MAG: acetate kinase [Candidatus Euphemobacter frigidus]|nr:acetate kinase [Candidatus Euphemobacter frigidus]MDP8276458.1 acetate kinase [Candidatus Euphemobacter frigidus]
MKILVLNCGSSSVKFQVIEISKERIKNNSITADARGLIERVGTDDAIINYEVPGQDKFRAVEPIKNHKKAIEKVLELLLDKNIGVLKSMKEIEAVGHRMVHGGEEFASSVLIDEKVLARMRECSDLAPLHNPANLKGYEACREVLPHVQNVGVFDTAFHQMMPPTSYLYAIPLKYYEKYMIRRFGFHGTSHRYVFYRYCKLTGREPAKTSAITCHLGNGASIAAIKDGKSLDTSMGFTPLEGLVMGTRSGDLDPAIHEYIINKEGIDIDEFTRILNKESGMLGLTEKASDMREIMEAAEAGDEKCGLALDIYCYRLKKYIGAYLAALNGADVIIFTGGVGENADLVREKSCGKLDFLGIELDPELNLEMNGGEGRISRESSRVEIYVIPTNEEMVIAWDTYQCVTGNPVT